MRDDWLEQWITNLKRGSGQSRAVLFLVLIFVAIAIWLLWGGTSQLWARWAGAGATIQIAGAWGDSFGPFNALVSALGFAAILSTLILQNIALKEQQRDQHLIRFDTTFFELLKLMRELRSELVFTQTTSMQNEGPKNLVRKAPQSGFDAIKYACYEVRFKSEGFIKENRPVSRDCVSKIYMDSVHKRFESRFAPYFRILYSILHKIREDGTLSASQKAYYGNLLRAQLTSHEIALLGFNATSKVAKDLDAHLTFFRMFKYLPESAARRILEGIFPSEAFEART